MTVWNDEKGFGFIVTDDGTERYFVHISAFGTIPRRPRIGDKIQFQVARAADGKQQAVNASIDGLQRLPAHSRRAAIRTRPRTSGHPRHVRSQRRHPARLGRALFLLLAIGSGIYAYQSFTPNAMQWESTSAPQPLSRPTATRQFRCSGKTYCSQMTSCDEAVFYLRNCPGTKMDGDGDGIPCESQWCTTY